MSNPISDVYTGVYDPAAQFTYSADEAKRILDEAGWRPGAGGVREKDGKKAAFELLYKAGTACAAIWRWRSRRR